MSPRSRYFAGLVAHVVGIIVLAMSALELGFAERWCTCAVALLGLLWVLGSLFVFEVRAGKELDR